MRIGLSADKRAIEEKKIDQILVGKPGFLGKALEIIDGFQAQLQ
jgi:hypothetical protein